MIAKLRPTVLLLALMASVSCILSLWMVLHYLQGGQVIARLWDNPELGILLSALLGATVGALIGSLLTLAGQCATDPPPPSIPAKEFPSIVRAIRDRRDSDGSDGDGA